jgi:methionyl-tRNA formyltransferase
MIDTIILLTGPVEEVALTGVLRRHNEDLTVHPVQTREQLEALDPAAIMRARLVGFVTPVVVPARILNALGFGAYNFHPGPPDYPGWIPAHVAIYDKANTFGATVHRMAEQVDAGPIVDVEMFDIPPGTSVTRLQEMAFTQAARLFWRLAPVLAIQSAPLAELPTKWTGTKSTSRMHKAMCDVGPDISPHELKRRIEAFGAGDFGVDLTVTLHGHKFRYVAPEPETKTKTEPAMRDPATLVA